MSAYAAKPRARPSPSPMQRMPVKAPMLGISDVRPSSPGPFQSGPALGLGADVQRQDASDIAGGSRSTRPSAEPRAGMAAGRPRPTLTVDRPDSGLEREVEATAEAAVERAGTPAPPPAMPRAPPSSAGAAVAAALDGAGGETLPPAEHALFERKLGANLSAVRIHDDAAAQAAAREIGARAFTHGRDIYFAAGEWRPGDPAGRRLLAHELAHTIQQAPAGLLLPERDVEADFAGRPTYPAATTPSRPPGTIGYEIAPGQQVYAPYAIYQPDEVPSWLHMMTMESSQALALGYTGQRIDEMFQQMMAGTLVSAEPTRLTVGDLVRFAEHQGPSQDIRLLIARVDGGYRFIGFDTSRASAGVVRAGFIESDPTSGGVGQVLFANRVTRALARGQSQMKLEVYTSERTAGFHAKIWRIVGKTGTPVEDDKYDLDTRQMVRIVLAWSDGLSPGERQALARLAAQEGAPTPQAAQAVLAANAGTGAEAEGVPAAGPMPLGPASGETMAMMERFRERLRGNIRRPLELNSVRELTDPEVQARVLDDYFGFAMAEGRLYRLERVGRGVRVNDVVPQPIVEPIEAPVGPVAPVEGLVIEPQVVNLDPGRAIRIGENVIPPNQTVAVLTPGEFIVGYAPNQLVALDPLTGHPLLGVYEGGQWYEILDANNAPIGFDPATGARIVNFGTKEEPIPAVEIDTDLGPQQTALQRAPVSTVAVGGASIIMVANELLRWVGATLEQQRATIAAGIAEKELWIRLCAAPVMDIWDADRMEPAEPEAKAQTGVVVSAFRFPYVADINADLLRAELLLRIKTYSEMAVVIASLGQFGALTQEDGRWIVKVNRPQGAGRKDYDITEALNTVEALSLAAADTTLRDRLAGRSQAEREGRILHIRQGATLFRSESESRFDERRQPLIGSGDRLGPNAWGRQIRSGSGGKLFVEPVNADAYRAVALTKYLILKDIEDVWRECREGGRQVVPAELPSFGEGPFTAFEAGPETTGQQRFGWTRYIKPPGDPSLAVTPNSTYAVGELLAFWVSDDDTTVVSDVDVATYLRE